MTIMNIILLEPDEIRGDSAEIRGRRLKHIRGILKSTCGDRLKIGVVNGPLGIGIVRSINGNSAQLDIALEESPPPRPATDLVLALPRPIMLKRILSQSASMGINRLHLINAARVEKSFFKASILEEHQYRDYLYHGLEQGVDTHVPEIHIHQRFKPFVEDVLPALKRQVTHSLLAHPAATKKLPALTSIPLKGGILVAIGPEGGWLDYEVEKFREQGVQTFTMGWRILKVDTTVTTILAQLDLLRNLQR